MIVITISLLISFKCYIETNDNSSFLFLLIPLTVWLRIPSIETLWKEEQEWEITLLPNLLRYYGPKPTAKISAELQFLGKILQEPKSNKTHYQADVKLSELKKLDILSSGGQSFAIEYSTKAGHNHRISYYDNIELIVQHCIDGVDKKCEVRHFTRRIPFIWP